MTKVVDEIKYKGRDDKINETVRIPKKQDRTDREDDGTREWNQPSDPDIKPGRGEAATYPTD